MPIPSFTDTLGGALGSGISIVRDGAIFSDDDCDGLDIEKMNAELVASSKHSDMEFLPMEEQTEDLPFKLFLESRHKESTTHKTKAK